MKRTELLFDRPAALQATEPPEARGLARDEVRLLVSTPEGHIHSTFNQLDNFLEPGDLLIVNHSATLPASLPASGAIGNFMVNLSTNYGNGLWLAEPRWGSNQPGVLPLAAGERINVAGIPVRLVTPYPALPRLWFVQAEGDLCAAMEKIWNSEEKSTK